MRMTITVVFSGMISICAPAVWAQQAQYSRPSPLLGAPSLFIEARQFSWDQLQYGPKARKKPLSAIEKRARRNAEILESYVDHVQFEQQPLGEIFEQFFAQEHGLTLDVDWDALAAEKVTPETEVTLELEGFSVEEVLAAVLDEAGEQVDTYQLSHYMLGGKVKVSTEDEFDKLILTRVYDISWLAMGVPHYVDAPEITLDWRKAALRYQFWAQRETLPTLAGTSLNPERNFQELRDQLIDVLLDFRPNSWETQGGQGSITIFGSKLVIHQTPEMQVLIGGKWW